MKKRTFGTSGWTPDRIGNLDGKKYIITGGNSGIGYEAANIFLAKGAAVTIVCRNPEKASEAVEALRAENPGAAVDWIQMDLADLASVEKAAGELKSANEKIDGLVLNAGIMMIPRQTLTEDGFETQIGVNHLGHFAFASRLANRVTAAAGRFIIVSSTAHKMGSRGINFDDINYNRGYSPTVVYSQSKLANILFMRELNDRLQAQGSGSVAIACHPGWSATNLQTTGPGKVSGAAMSFLNHVFAQSAEKGSWPIVLSAVDKDARGGAYYGPTKWHEFLGPVDECPIDPRGLDAEAGRRLWQLSEEMTGVKWPSLR